MQGEEATVKYWGHWFTPFTPFFTRKKYFDSFYYINEIEKNET